MTMTKTVTNTISNFNPDNIVELGKEFQGIPVYPLETVTEHPYQITIKFHDIDLVSDLQRDLVESMVDSLGLGVQATKIDFPGSKHQITQLQNKICLKIVSKYLEHNFLNGAYKKFFGAKNHYCVVHFSEYHDFKKALTDLQNSKFKITKLRGVINKNHMEKMQDSIYILDSRDKLYLNKFTHKVYLFEPDRVREPYRTRGIKSQDLKRPGNLGMFLSRDFMWGLRDHLKNKQRDADDFQFRINYGYITIFCNRDFIDSELSFMGLYFPGLVKGIFETINTENI